MADDAKFAKGICPECQRVISGRLLGHPATRMTRKVELLQHKNFTRTAPCNGGRKVVEAMLEVPREIPEDGDHDR